MSPLPPFLDLPPTGHETPRPRSAGRAVLLAALFGPFGLFYASPAAGLFMTFVCIVVASFTVGVGLFFAWPLCILMAYFATAGDHPRPPEPGSGE